MNQKLVFLSSLAAALAASESAGSESAGSESAAPSVTATPALLGITTSYTGTLALAYYSALNSVYAQPSVASALAAYGTIASDDQSAQLLWVNSFYGTFGSQFNSVASQYADVFTQDDLASGSVTVGSADPSELSALLASATSNGSVGDIVSGISSAQLKATSGSGSKSGSKSGSDSESGSSSGSGSSSRSGSSSGSGSSQSNSASGSSSSSDNGGARSGSYMAAGGVAGVVALALL